MAVMGNHIQRDHRHEAAPIRMNSSATSFDVSFVHNTIHNAMPSFSGTGWSFGDNLYWDAGRGVAAPAGDTLAVTGGPKFANAAGNDFSLQAGSPAIDKATQALPFGVADDFTALVARPQGAASDIGAFEYKP
jgi:hypothetical protein